MCQLFLRWQKLTASLKCEISTGRYSMESLVSYQACTPAEALHPLKFEIFLLIEQRRGNERSLVWCGNLVCGKFVQW